MINKKSTNQESVMMMMKLIKIDKMVITFNI
jgi:hypothetical protein